MSGMQGHNAVPGKQGFQRVSGAVPDCDDLGGENEAPEPDRPVDPKEAQRRADRELVAARKALDKARVALREAENRVRSAETATLAVRKDELAAQLLAAGRAYEQARDKLPRTWPADLGAIDVAAVRSDVDAANLASGALSQARLAAMRANGWAWGAPEVKRWDEIDADERFTRDVVGDAERSLRYVEAFQASDDPARRAAFAKAAHQIIRHGYGEGHGMPCTSCGDPMNGYNDDYYYCRYCG